MESIKERNLGVLWSALGFKTGSCRVCSRHTQLKEKSGKIYFQSLWFSGLLLFCCCLQSTTAKTIILSDRTGSITYPPKEGDYWRIIMDSKNVVQNGTITISFTKFNLGGGYDCTGADYLEIGPSPRRKCCGNSLPQPYTSQQDRVWIDFYSNRSKNDSWLSHKDYGFNLTYISSIKWSSKGCLENEYQCSGTRKCILASWCCNGMNECEDGSDEWSCGNLTTDTYEWWPTLPPKTTGVRTTTDPTPRYSCPANELGCIASDTSYDGFMYRCISNNKLCDGIRDCWNGLDESDSRCKKTTSLPRDNECSWNKFPCEDMYEANIYCESTSTLCSGGLDSICSNAESQKRLHCQKTTSPPPDTECSWNQFPCEGMHETNIYCQSTSSLCSGGLDSFCSNAESQKRLHCKQTTVASGLPACRHPIHEENTTGWFSSPNYPNDADAGSYGSYMDCSWSFHRPDREARIQIRFVDFNIPAFSGSYLEVWDGPDENSPVISRYDGSNRPPLVITSTRNYLYVRYHHRDGYQFEEKFNATYQQKGECLSDQFSCGLLEYNCYDIKQRCDGVWDCPSYGYDEMGCGRCQPDQYSCGLGSLMCYSVTDRCNGVAKCANHADETGCTDKNCGSHNGTFLCKNTHCIYETWTCDKRDDCGDGSDEEGCHASPSRRVIIAAIAGSLICALLLMILLGCSCKLYSLRVSERHGGPRHETAMSRLYAEFCRRRAPPPYHEAMATSRNFDEAQREFMDQARNSGRRGRRHRHRSRSNQQNGGNNNDGLENTETGTASGETEPTDSSGIELAHNSSAVPMEPLASSSANNENSPQDSAVINVASDSESDSDSSDSELIDINEDSEVSVCQASGGTARWSRSTPDREQLSLGIDSVTENSVEEPSMPHLHDTQSIDTTASASIDGLDVSETNPSQETEEDKDPDTTCIQVDQSNSNPNEPKPGHNRQDDTIDQETNRRNSRNSLGSLSSNGSEIFNNDDDVPLIES